jgi:hypothetical protein
VDCGDGLAIAKRWKDVLSVKHVQLFTSKLEGKGERNAYDRIRRKNPLYLELPCCRNLWEPAGVSKINYVAIAIRLDRGQITKQLQTIIFVAGRLTTQRVAIDTDLHKIRSQQPTQVMLT